MKALWLLGRGLLLALTVAFPVRASPDIASDFESGGLLKSDSPPGPWSTSWRPSSANTLATSPEAAHRGRLGLRLVDQDTAAKAYGQDDISYDTWYPAGATECLRTQRNTPLSHDNLFHSVLGLLGIQAREYRPALDAFAACRKPLSPVAAPT